MRQEIIVIDLPFAAGGYECAADFYSIGGEHLVVLKDHRKNPIGITNAVEYAATAAFALLADAPEIKNVRFVQVSMSGKCAEVRFLSNDGNDRFSKPAWREITAQQLDSIINQYELCAA